MADHRKTLSDLGLTASGGRKADVTGLAVDSREVRDGFSVCRAAGQQCAWGDVYPIRLSRTRCDCDPYRSGGCTIWQLMSRLHRTWRSYWTDDPRQNSGLCGGALVGWAAKHDDRGYRHQRQDVGIDVLSPDLGRNGLCCG